MTVKVIDASALAAVLFGEPAGREVSERMEAALLVAPTLLRYEMGSVGLKKIRRYPERKDALIRMLQLFERLEIWGIDIPTLASVELAERENLTMYDAAYLWLARTLDAELVTLDAKLMAAAAR